MQVVEDTPTVDASEAERLRQEIERLHEEVAFTKLRYDLMVQASGIGLWDMSVQAGDPVNPTTSSGGATSSGT